MCVATATKLNDTDHLNATQPLVTGVLRFVDGRWVSDREKFRLSNERCTVDSAAVEVAGFNSAVEQWNLEPQTDTTLRGTITVTDTSSECGTEGRVYVQCPTLTRIGDAPVGVPIADPKTVQAPPPPVPIQPAPGGVFDGMYRVDLEYTKTTVENGKLATTSADGAEWWAFRSACSDSGCVATGALLDDSSHQEAAGSATVLQLANGRWEDAGGHPMLISCQWARGGENVVKSSWFSQQNPDGAVTEERTLSVTTNGCGDAGLVSRTPLRADRVGDVPSSVILADPALCLS